MTVGYIDTPFGSRQVSIYAIDYDVLFKAFPRLEIIEGTRPNSHDTCCGIIGYWVSRDIVRGHVVCTPGDVLRITIVHSLGRGQYSVRRVNIRVAGILGEYGGAIGLSPDNIVFLPLDSGYRLLGLRKWTGLIVIVEKPEYVELITEKLRRDYHGLASIVSFKEITHAVSKIASGINYIVFSTSLSAFAVATAGIAATMITSVVARTREIGVLKALGLEIRIYYC